VDKNGDEILVGRAKAGSESAFAELVRNYREKAVHIAWGITGDEQVAEDISQESFIKIYRSLKNFREESKFSTWFYRIVVNLAVDYQRRKKLRSYIPLMKIREPVEPRNPALELKAGEFNRVVQNVLERLSAKQRAVFELKNFQGMALDEIARIMKCRTGTVKSHLFRAVEKMRKELQDRET